jgi:hypothetical protein
MINHGISSERSQDHWPFFEVKGKNVLDLGCGRHQTYDINDHSPTYFLNKGANLVVGIDASKEEVDYYNNYDFNLKSKLIVEQKFINSPEEILSLIKSHDITAIKCDIEGGEINLYPLTKTDLDKIEEIAIEYHTDEIKDNISKKLQEWGFVIKAEAVFTYCHAPGMGVIFAEKK